MISVKRGSVPNFEDEIYRVFREAAQPAVAAGLATLEEENPPREGWDCLLLRPKNPEACELRVYPDHRTLCMGKKQSCTETGSSSPA